MALPLMFTKNAKLRLDERYKYSNLRLNSATAGPQPLTWTQQLQGVFGPLTGLTAPPHPWPLTLILTSAVSRPRDLPSPRVIAPSAIQIFPLLRQLDFSLCRFILHCCRRALLKHLSLVSLGARGSLGITDGFGVWGGRF